jgi:hypothetical protein
MTKRLILLSFFLMFIFVNLFPQTILAPNIAMKSHSTLDIRKIIRNEEKTEIWLSIENRISGGNFCADKNIYIALPDGTRRQLLLSNGIPVCPEVYRFKAVGEKLDFILTFPPLEKGIESFNLIEDCQDNCFSFYGVILEEGLNKRLDDAFSLAENGEPSKALVSFTKIAEETGNKNAGAEGLLYLNLVALSASTGNKVKAAEWYKKLESSGLPETSLYIKHLNSLGIKY